MKMPDGGTRPAYNAQFVTDTQTGVVVGVDASNACNDANQLTPMVEEVRLNTGKQPKNILVRWRLQHPDECELGGGE